MDLILSFIHPSVVVWRLNRAQGGIRRQGLISQEVRRMETRNPGCPASHLRLIQLERAGMWEAVVTASDDCGGPSGMSGMA